MRVVVPLFVLTLAGSVAVAADRTGLAIVNSDLGPNMAPFALEDLKPMLGDTVDVSKGFDALHGLNGMAFGKGQFDALSPPASWPAVLMAPWREGVKACKAVDATDPKAPGKCGSALKASLWQQFLELEGVTRVVVVKWRFVPVGERYQLEASGYATNAKKMRVSPQPTVTREKAVGVVRGLVKDVVAGRGASQDRPVAPAK